MLLVLWLGDCGINPGVSWAVAQPQFSVHGCLSVCFSCFLLIKAADLMQKHGAQIQASMCVFQNLCLPYFWSHESVTEGSWIGAELWMPRHIYNYSNAKMLPSPLWLWGSPHVWSQILSKDGATWRGTGNLASHVSLLLQLIYGRDSSAGCFGVIYA